MIKEQDIKVIEEALRYCCGEGAKEIEGAVNLVKEWRKAPVALRNSQFKDLEYSLKVYEAWNSNPTLNGCTPQKAMELIKIYERWQSHHLLKSKQPHEITKAVALAS